VSTREGSFNAQVSCRNSHKSRRRHTTLHQYQQPQEIGWGERVRNKLSCVHERDVKPLLKLRQWDQYEMHHQPPPSTVDTPAPE